jgi:hypothetical protein
MSDERPGHTLQATALVVHQRETTIPADRRTQVTLAGKRIVVLYESWAKHEDAAEWRLKLQSK